MFIQIRGGKRVLSDIQIARKCTLKKNGHYGELLCESIGSGRCLVTRLSTNEKVETMVVILGALFSIDFFSRL